MRLISQDGTIDVPYDYFSLSVASGKYKDIEVAYIYYNNLSSTNGTKLAEYSTKAKAIKVMEMIRKSYTGYIFCKEDVMMRAEMSENEKITNLMESFLYFKFPKDEDVEV